LSERRHSAQLDKTETQGAESINSGSMFVQPSGDAHRVGKRDTHHCGRVLGQSSTDRISEELVKRMNSPSQTQGVQCEPVAGLRRQPEQQGAQ
jgi:hypothetical protein